MRVTIRLRVAGQPTGHPAASGRRNTGERLAEATTASGSGDIEERGRPPGTCSGTPGGRGRAPARGSSTRRHGLGELAAPQRCRARPRARSATQSASREGRYEVRAGHRVSRPRSACSAGGPLLRPRHGQQVLRRRPSGRRRRTLDVHGDQPRRRAVLLVGRRSRPADRNDPGLSPVRLAEPAPATGSSRWPSRSRRHPETLAARAR